MAAWAFTILLIGCGFFTASSFFFNWPIPLQPIYKPGYPDTKLNPEEQRLHDLEHELSDILSGPPSLVAAKAPGIATAIDETNEYAMNLGNAIQRDEYAAYAYMLTAQCTDSNADRKHFAQTAVDRVESALHNVDVAIKRQQAGIDAYYFKCLDELRQNQDQERVLEIKSKALAMLADEDKSLGAKAIEDWKSIDPGYRMQHDQEVMSDKWLGSLLAADKAAKT